MKWKFKFTDGTSVSFEGDDWLDAEEKACLYAEEHDLFFDLG